MSSNADSQTSSSSGVIPGSPPLIALFTDFGHQGPYVGQMTAVLAARARGVPIVDLMSDVPAFNVLAAAHLLAALVPQFPEQTVFLCVVDPGVGTDSRKPMVARIDGRWFVGPGNGLFDVVAARATRCEWWEIDWRPPRLSRSFHGRDLFAPVAAMLANGAPPPGTPVDAGLHNPGAGAALHEVVYVDGFGNVWTGIRAAGLDRGATLTCKACRAGYAGTFAEASIGEPLWHDNSQGLVEIALNQGDAAREFGIAIGDAVSV